MGIIAAIVLAVLLSGLILIGLYGRVPPPGEIRNCPCEGCKILREAPKPKARTLRDRLAAKGGSNG